MLARFRLDWQIRQKLVQNCTIDLQHIAVTGQILGLVYDISITALSKFDIP